jgi:hypothetical protein
MFLMFLFNSDLSYLCLIPPTFIPDVHVLATDSIHVAHFVQFVHFRQNSSF